MKKNIAAFTELPVVDVSGLLSKDEQEKLKVAHKLDEVAKSVGFFYVLGHGVSENRAKNLKNRAKDFFSLSEKSKMQYYIGNSDNHSGFVPMGEEVFYGNSDTIDAKESFDIGFEVTDSTRKTPVLGENQWPSLSGFRNDVQAYYDEVLRLGNLIFQGFALGLGLKQNFFTKNITAPPSQLRLIHYFYDPNSPQDSPGIGAHTDYEFFTILLPTSPGLQVLNGLGDWIDVPILENSFVVNIGDMMEIATNGRYVATAHRVKKIDQERYAFPLFCNLDYDTIVAPIPELCQEIPPKYEPVHCGEHLVAQTIQTFGYLKDRLRKSQIEMPKNAKNLSSFGNPKLKNVD